ncbi:MAG: class I SAM-dependent methyltransferase [Pseudomonadota bacterium]
MTEICPLCAGEHCSLYHQDAAREYWICATCDLVHVPSGFFLSPEDERLEYEQHENSIGEPGYERFLSRLANPLLERLTLQSSGLDFGCGPAPALARMLEREGHRVAVYDAFFASDPRVFKQRYAFITATEVVEHLHEPGAELQRLWSLIEPGGWLAVMTKLVSDPEAFANWHYIRDPTHVCFFSRRSWQWWADCQGAALAFEGADVMLLQKTAQPSRH